MDHAHVRVRDARLPHRLLLESVDEVLEAIGALGLVVHALLGLQGLDHAPHIVLIRVLVRVQVHVAHYVVFGNSEVLVLTVQLRDMLDKFAGVETDSLLILPFKQGLRHLVRVVVVFCFD